MTPKEPAFRAARVPRGPGGLRRPLLHASLAMVATPLPGGLLLAGRAVQAGRPWRALVSLLIAGLGTASGLALSYWLPWSVHPTALLLSGLWLVWGLVLYGWERAGRLSPVVDTADTRFVLRRAALWSVVVPITWIPVAFLIAMLSSRWGLAIVGKPSYPARILLAALLWLVPVGLGLGLARAILRRPFALSAPLAFAAGFPALVTAVLAGLGAVGASFMLANEPFLVTPVPEHIPDWPTDIAVTLAGLLCLFVLAEYLANAVSLTGFLGRTALAGGALFCLLLNLSLAFSVAQTSYLNRAALDAMARGEPGRARAHIDRLLRRAPLADVALENVERGALIALESGDAASARAFLERTRGPAARVYPCHGLCESAEALLASSLETSDAVSVQVEPVRPESYLDSNWCAALTALGAARPELSQAELKHRLQALSLSRRAIELAQLDGFQDLSSIARVFDCEAIPIPAGGLAAQLEAGRPLLFRDPLSKSWGLVIWYSAASDAVIWLDYRRWSQRSDRLLRRKEASRLMTSDDLSELGSERILSRIRHLDAGSRLERRLDLDGGWFASIVPASEVDPAGSSVTRSDELATLWTARKALERGASSRAASLAAKLPEGPGRSELDMLADMGAVARSLGRGQVVAEASRFVPSAQELQRLSPWGLERLCLNWYAFPELGCDTLSAIVERNAALYAQDPSMQLELMHLRLAAGNLDAAVRAAQDAAHAAGFRTRVILKILETLAPHASQGPGVGTALEKLQSGLPWLVEDEDVGLRPRSGFAAYHASRAALALSPAEAVSHWRRAVELEPNRASYCSALATALAAVGQNHEAGRWRRLAGSLVGVRDCLARAPVCEPTPRQDEAP